MTRQSSLKLPASFPMSTTREKRAHCLLRGAEAFVRAPAEIWRDARRYLTWLMPKYLEYSNRQTAQGRRPTKQPSERFLLPSPPLLSRLITILRERRNYCECHNISRLELKRDEARGTTRIAELARSWL